MKKFAILAVAGFIASSTIACSDGGEENTLPSSSSGGGVQLGDSWTKKGTVELGGASNSDLGSFLDIDQDPFKVYKKVESATNKDIIDFIFDGSNFLTPAGCLTSSVAFCGAQMTGYNPELVADLVNISNVSALTAASTPDDISNYVASHFDDEGNPDDDFNSRIVIAAPAVAGGKFLVATNGGNLAFVVVSSIDGTVSVATLAIGRTPMPQ
jgi:hypothetical protein